MRSDAIGVIEAAYALEPDDGRWLHAVLQAAQPALDAGLGVAGYFLDASNLDRIEVASPQLLGGPPASAFAFAELAAALQRPVDEQRALGILGTPQTAEHLYAGSHHVSTASQMLGTGAWLSNAAVQRWLHPLGIADLLTIKTVDLDRRGLVLIAPLSTVTRARRDDSVLWSRIAAHLAAGNRVRQRLRRSGASSPFDGAEAVLRPDGKFEDARGAATKKSAREILRSMALAMEEARGPLRRRNVDLAVSMWTALVAGRWTLVEHFDRGGRRYLVAHRNEPGGEGPLTLTPRERQVAGFAARGHGLKLIAYELGLSTASISHSLSAASTKLGVRSRGELARVWATTIGLGEDEMARLGSGLDGFASGAVELERPATRSRLTPTELAIVTSIVRGESNASIARARGTSPRTVANQIARIFKKVGVGSRAAVASWAAGSVRS